MTGLERRFGERRALADVGFTAAAGERLAVIGPNGAGKTTLLSIIAGTLKPDAGSVELAGKVGFVPQQPALYRKLTVAENLRLFARLEGIADEELERAARADARPDRARASAATTRSGRCPAATSSASTSRSACSPEPAVLLLDEPSTGLDPRQRERLWEFVLGLAERGTSVIFTTHNIAEAERYGRRLLVLADGECLFDGAPAELHRRGVRGSRARGGPRLRSCLRRLPARAGPLGGRRMRWLLAKDLTLLRRSPLVTALLVLYPIVIAVLIGFALSGGPSKPRVAFLNEVPEDTPLNVGGESFDIVGARDELCQRIECVRVDSEQEARDLVDSGDVLGALILPPDLIEDLQSLTGLNPTPPTVKVLVNEENPVKGQLVDDRINSLLAEANLKVRQQIADVSIDLPRACSSTAARSASSARTSRSSGSSTPTTCSGNCGRTCRRRIAASSTR